MKENVTIIDHMGSDLSVVNAARVSFGKAHKKLTDGDKNLIKFLAKHGHWTPFGHCTRYRYEVIVWTYSKIC